MLCVAIDVMGNDYGPKPAIEGVIQALKEKEFKAYLVGDKDSFAHLVPEEYEKNLVYVDTKGFISMSQQATDALKDKETSIYKAIELVRDGTCQAIVSAGHSGATMSLATLRIGRINQVLRPAIATLLPSTASRPSLMLDVGANVDCKPEHLVQFAIMGNAYAREVMGIKKPRVGLLSNGEESSKGNELTKEAYKLLKNHPNFCGNVEGGDLFDGSVDVIVCDGFNGNLVLKSIEGVGKAVTRMLKQNIKKSFLGIIGAIFMSGTFKKIKKTIDYDEYGGAPLLGIKNCTIISHGKSSPKAIKNAIFQALKFADSNINEVIEKDIAQFNSESKNA